MITDETATIGPTGDYPDGKAAPDDNGGLNIKFTVDTAADLIRLDFGVPVAWIGLRADDARRIAFKLVGYAAMLNGH